ncbi:alpha/beta hydrolase [bacterium]|nr:alpha/beta hydrolase [bacterium]
MTYDPFSRGPYPVGVRSYDTLDPARERPLAVEVWYPAGEAARGRDVDPATRDAFELLPGFPPVWQEAARDAAARPGRYPLVLFSHGFGGHRRQSTFLCTHLASHGYVVAAADHTGNTMTDIMQAMLQIAGGGAPPDFDGELDRFIALRPDDVLFLLDTMLGDLDREIAPLIDATQIGMSGHSFGGWTTLKLNEREPRIRAALPLAPAGGWTHMPAEPLRRALTFAWPHPVATTYLVADRDSLLPLRGMRELYERTPGAKRLFVLRDADHMHFCDRVEEVHEMFRAVPPPGAFTEVAASVPPISELVPGEHAYVFTRGLGLAHFDAALRGEAAAAAVLDDAVAALAERGVAIEAA